MSAKILFLLIFLIAFSVIFCQAETGTLRGEIIDSSSGEMIPYTVIQLVGKDLYTISNKDGNFEIKKVPYGSYKLRMSHLGYFTREIAYNFSESEKKPLSIYLKAEPINLGQVTVEDRLMTTSIEEFNEAANVLKGGELQNLLELSLAGTIKNELGLALRSMGPAPARPVIRGMGQDRVLITEEGNKTVDLSSTSPDHAVTVEPFTIERIELIRGPKVLLQSPTTIGGIVNVVRNEIPVSQPDHFHMVLGGYGESANKGYLGSIVTEVPLDPLSFRFELSRRITENLKTPAGDLENSYSNNLNFSAGGTYFTDFGLFGVSYRNFDLDYGIPGGFIGAHPDGVDIELYRRQLNLKSQIDMNSDLLENLEVDYNYTLYRHKEFEASGRIGSEFKILNHSAKINLNHKGLAFLDKGTAGISFDYKDFNIGGFVFTPPTRSINLAAYLFETFSLGNFDFEAGARFNWDDIKPETEKPDSKIGYIRERNFATYSLSLLSLYKIGENYFLGANLSKSSRVPSIEELFSEGPHLAAYSYEIGNPDLKDESGIGSEIFFYINHPNIYFDVNIFYNNLNNYIIPRNSGEINYSTFLPIYVTTGIGAELYGAEAQFNWHVISNIEIKFKSSYTRGEFKNNSEPLPQIPPLKGLVGIEYGLDNFRFGIDGEWANPQNSRRRF